MLRFRPEFDLNDEEDNALLAQHLDDVERGFDFLLTPHLDRRVRRLGVRHRNYVGRLMQRGGGAPLTIQQQRDILPRQMEQALQRAIRDQILEDPEVRPDDHFLININSNRLRHSYHSTRMRVREWTDNDLRAREIMQQISRMLNSNEQFRLDDSFSLTFLTLETLVGEQVTSASVKDRWHSRNYWNSRRASSRSRTTRMNCAAPAPSSP